MNIRKSLFGIPSQRRNDGPEFPPPAPRRPTVVFNPGDSVIVTTACEDIALHELTGVVNSLARTGSIIVKLDVDDSLLPFRPSEIGHRY